MQQNSVNFCSLIKFVNEKKLLHKERSGFRPSDSCECQQFSIVHGIYKLFDCNPPFEFTEFWFSLIYEPIMRNSRTPPKALGEKNTSRKLIENFLSNRYQMVVLNGQSPTWEKVSARATQGCVYIRSFVFLNVYQWSYLWIIINSSSCYNIQVFGISCERNLDLQLDKKFNFTYHINIIIFKADEGIGITRKLYKVRLGISLITICKSFIWPWLWRLHFWSTSKV